MRDSFKRYNPKTNFIYFVLVIIATMIYVNPVVLTMSFLAAAMYMIYVEGRKAVGYILMTVPLFIFIAVINPLFSNRGETVLFTYFNNRKFTAEALYYGFYMGVFCIGLILWFNRYNSVLELDKLYALFGRIFPSISMVLIVGLRYVPTISKKGKEIRRARKAIGRSEDKGKIAEGMDTLSVMTSWSLESANTTTYSIKGRGYGLRPKTTYSDYRMKKRDYILLLELIICLVIIVTVGNKENMSFEFYPTIKLAKLNIETVVVYIAYFVMYMTPFAINILEDIRWRSLQSKI